MRARFRALVAPWEVFSKKVGSIMRDVICLAAAIVGMPAGTAAQDAAPQLEAVIGCRSEAKRDARLACFDRTVAALDRARIEKTVLVLDRNAVVARKQKRFGLTSPPGEAFGGGDADRRTAVVDLDTTIQRATPDMAMAGRWNLALANGMVWQTLEDLPHIPAPGTAIKLRRSSLGGFRASISGQSRGVPVKRLR
ncbi:hypothetical protein [Sphingomonas rubra]|uniref:hypothetical protein n=1 Tax=Sphingomonas rubra TaxID=634430 RepID=UPI0015A5C497|nr:hypothetical protein [Sphingomonas rubra]